VTAGPQLSPIDQATMAKLAELFQPPVRSAKDARTPGELAQMLDPTTVQTSALELREIRDGRRLGRGGFCPRDRRVDQAVPVATTVVAEMGVPDGVE
jgi:hypothetical protein